MKIFRLLICAIVLISLISHICYLIKMSEVQSSSLKLFFTILANLMLFIFAITLAVVLYERNFREKKEAVKN